MFKFTKNLRFCLTPIFAELCIVFFLSSCAPDLSDLKYPRDHEVSFSMNGQVTSIEPIKASSFNSDNTVSEKSSYASVNSSVSERVGSSTNSGLVVLAGLLIGGAVENISHLTSSNDLNKYTIKIHSHEQKDKTNGLSNNLKNTILKFLSTRTIEIVERKDKNISIGTNVQITLAEKYISILPV